MKNFSLILVFFFFLKTTAAQIVSGEYFWNTDPGLGNAIALPSSVFTNSTNETFDFQPSTSGLSSGTHRLFVRFKDIDDNWSQLVSKLVLIGEEGLSGLGQDEVGKLEYFWDFNPLTIYSLNLSNPVVDNNYALNFSTDNLPSGNNILNLRVKDKDGLWSQWVRKNILINGNSPIPNMQRIEYFIDTDMGLGTSQSVVFSPANSPDVASDFEVLTDTLTNGTHIFHIRVQDNESNWSSVYSKAFIVDPQFSLTAGILNTIYHCPGGEVKVPILKTGAWPSGNTFSIELSDDTGNNFVPIVTTENFSVLADTLVGVLPSNLSFGTGYKVRVVSSLPYIRDTSATLLTIGNMVNAGSNSPVCQNNTINLTATASTPSTYSWTGPNTYASILQNPSISSAQLINGGVYSVTATNPAGCTATQTITVVVNPLPDITRSSNSPVCQGNTLNLTASGGATYAWSGPSGFSSALQNPSITNVALNAAGVYSVTVTTALGCSASVTTSVVVNPLPNITRSSNSPVCQGNTLNLTASGGATYAWSGPSGFSSSLQNPSITNVALNTAGVYSVTVTTALGCSASATTSVVVNPLPNITRSSNSPVCQGNTLNLTASGGATYAWSGPSGFSSALQNPSIPNVALNAAGVYSVTVTTALGCSASATTSVVVNPLPNITRSSNSPVCQGNTLNLTASGGATYAWSGPSGFSSSLQNPSITNVALNAAGVYSVTVTTALGCSASATTSVMVNPLPNITRSSNSPVCQGNTLNLTASGGATYAWSGPSGFSSALQNPSITNVALNAAGVYSVTVTTSLGCSASATTSVVVNPLPDITRSSNSPVCQGNTLNLTASGGATYAWSGPSGFSSALQNPSITNVALNAAGVYSVTVTTALGCSASVTTSVVVNINPIINAGNSSPVCSGTNFTLNATGGNSYSWTGPGSFNSTSQNPVVNNSLGGIYTVSGFSLENCSSTATTLVTVNPLPNLITNSQILNGGSVNLTLPQVTAGSNLPSGTTLSYFTNAPATNQLANPNSVAIQGTYYIKATSPAGCIKITSVIVSPNCLGQTTLASPTNNQNSGEINRVSSEGFIGTHKILGTSRSTLDAKKSVLLNPGFEAVNGTTFLAMIGGCN
jgi:hypothetical protein